MESKTKDLTYIAIVLAIGAVLKLLSDLFTRTVLFFLFIDPLLLTDVFLLLKYPKIKVTLIITAVQSILGVHYFNNRYVVYKTCYSIAMFYICKDIQ